MHLCAFKNLLSTSTVKTILQSVNILARPNNSKFLFEGSDLVLQLG